MSVTAPLRPQADTFRPSTVRSAPVHERDAKLNRMLNKVPAVTLAFWVVKMMSTTVGETAADYLQFNVGLGIEITTILMSVLFFTALAWQMTRDRYMPSPYWLTVVLVSIVGTLVTDYLVDVAGVSLVSASLGFGLALGLTFAAWFASERTLSIHSIFTHRREAFYWAAILFTFALGTAAGDLFAEAMGLGYATSAVIFAAVIGAVYAAYRFGMNAVLAFWAAYVLTRPFGASLGDWLSQPVANGGLGLGVTGTSMLFLVVIAGLVGWMTFKQRTHHDEWSDQAA